MTESDNVSLAFMQAHVDQLQRENADLRRQVAWHEETLRRMQEGLDRILTRANVISVGLSAVTENSSRVGQAIDRALARLEGEKDAG